MNTSLVYINFSAEIVPNTVEAFMGILANECNAGAKEICILISTLGGSVAHGVTLYNFIKSLPAKVTMHNIGVIDSIGNVIFLAGEKRYAVPNSSFLFHGVGLDLLQPIRLEEKMLREHLTGLDRDQELIGKIITGETRITLEESDKMFLNAVTKTPEQAKELGIINSIKDAKIPEGARVVQFVFQQRPWK